MKQQERISILQDIVKMNTVNGNEKLVADYLQKLFEKQGIACEQIEYSENRNQLIATLDFGNAGKTLGFCGHMDVVPVGEAEWKHPPFAGVIEDGKLHGRGAADMKGGLVALAVAILELKEANVPLRGKIKYLATVGEETSAIGAGQLVQKGLCNDLDALLIGEPMDLSLAITHRGALWLRFTTYGKTAHGSMPHLGINAVESMIKLVEGIKGILTFEGLNDELLGTPTYSLNRFSGGKATNVIPDECVAEFDIRTLPSQNHAEMIAQAQKVVDKLSKECDKFKAKIEVINDLPSVYTSPDDPFAKLVGEAIENATGKPAVVKSLSGYTDASQFAKAAKKFPILITGPGPGELSHQPNEYLDLGLYEKSIELFKDIATKYLA